MYSICYPRHCQSCNNPRFTLTNLIFHQTKLQVNPYWRDLVQESVYISVILSFIFITIVEANCKTNIIFWPIDIETVHYLQYFERFDNVRRNFCIFFFLIYLGFTYQPILLLHRLDQPQGTYFVYQSTTELIWWCFMSLSFESALFIRA